MDDLNPEMPRCEQCERLADPQEFDFCEQCTSHLCSTCMAEWCCGEVPAISGVGMDNLNDDDALALHPVISDEDRAASAAHAAAEAAREFAAERWMAAELALWVDDHLGDDRDDDGPDGLD